LSCFGEQSKKSALQTLSQHTNQLAPLAVASLEPIALLPNVPTVNESDGPVRCQRLVRHCGSKADAAQHHQAGIMSLARKPKGFDGGEAERYFREGKIREVADYWPTDVVNTYRVRLRYELFRGTLSQDAFEASERNLADFMIVRPLTLKACRRVVDERRRRLPAP
jgi:hypothetical protein